MSKTIFGSQKTVFYVRNRRWLTKKIKFCVRRKFPDGITSIISKKVLEAICFTNGFGKHRFWYLGLKVLKCLLVIILFHIYQNPFYISILWPGRVIGIFIIYLYCNDSNTRVILISYSLTEAKFYFLCHKQIVWVDILFHQTR